MKRYLVGGAVRDKLMGIEPADRDYVVVGSTPEEMLALGYQQVGSSFPVFLHPVTKEEHALARAEKKCGEGYHGFTVDFNPSISLEEDLSRRDLTVNSIAYDEETDSYIDPFAGRKDIVSRTLRHTSTAFSEDPLRVVRLARFASRFHSFTIHKSTINLAKSIIFDNQLNELPNERMAEEIRKMFDCANKDGAGRFFDLLEGFGVIGHSDFFAGADMCWLKKVAKISANLEGNTRILVFAALSRMPNNIQVQLAGRDAVFFGKLVEKQRNFGPRSPENVLDFINCAGGFSSDESKWLTLQLILCIGRICGDQFGISDRELICARAVSAPISKLAVWLHADGLSGSQIGDILKNERIRALSNIF